MLDVHRNVYRPDADGNMQPVPEDQIDARMKRGMTISVADASTPDCESGRRRILIDGEPLPLYTSGQVKVDYMRYTGPGVRGDTTSAVVWVPLMVHTGLDIAPELVESGQVVITTPPEAFSWENQDVIDAPMVDDAS